MPSEYQIITLAELESYATEDYSGYASAGGSAKYTDAMVESKISQAERYVLGRIDTEYAATIPKRVKWAVMEYSKWLMDEQLFIDTYKKDAPIELRVLLGIINDTVKPEEAQGTLKDYTSVEDYNR